MKTKTLWITETAAMLALLIALQWVTSYIPKPAGQFVTGSCVNAILAVAGLFVGLSSGVCVAVLSPIFAYLFGIAPNLATVPVIMAGNAVFVLLLHWLANSSVHKNIIAWLSAALAKFAVMYALVVWVVCGLAADALLVQGVLKKPMLTLLPATFSWPQLITALIGGGLALFIVPSLKKALHRAS